MCCRTKCQSNKRTTFTFWKKEKKKKKISKSNNIKINKLDLCARIFDVKSRHRRVLFIITHKYILIRIRHWHRFSTDMLLKFALHAAYCQWECTHLNIPNGKINNVVFVHFTRVLQLAVVPIGVSSFTLFYSFKVSI